MIKVNKWIIALTVVLPTLIEVIDTSVVNVSLDHIRGSLSAGLDEATWAITAYLVSNAIIIPLTGWLSRFFGRKHYLLFSVTLFTLSSFMCGSATSLTMLVSFRILQGIGGGALQPLSQSILLEAFPPAEYGMAMALFFVGVLVGPILGPVLGGWITDNWSWNWIFYINIPIGIVTLIMIMLFIHDPDYLKKAKETVDYWGIALITVGVGSLQIILDKGQREDWFSSAFILRLAVISTICLITFVIVELKTRHPVVNLREFKDRSFATANIIQFVSFFVLFGSIVLLPLFLQELMGYTSFLAGLALAPGGVAAMLINPLTGKLVTKVNPKAVLIAGLIVTAYSVFTMTQFNLYVSFNIVAWSRFIMGIGIGMVFVPLASMAFATIKKEEMGNATSIFNLIRNIAGSFGVAFVTTFIARRMQFHQFRFSEELNPFSQRYQFALGKAINVLGIKLGAASKLGGNEIIYQELIKQSNLYSFIDAFYACTVIMICVIPLVLLLKGPKDAGGVTITH